MRAIKRPSPGVLSADSRSSEVVTPAITTSPELEMAMAFGLS